MAGWGRCRVLLRVVLSLVEGDEKVTELSELQALKSLKKKIEARIKFTQDRVTKGEITLVEMANRVYELEWVRSKLKELFSAEKRSVNNAVFCSRYGSYVQFTPECIKCSTKCSFWEKGSGAKA